MLIDMTYEDDVPEETVLKVTKEMLQHLGRGKAWFVEPGHEPYRITGQSSHLREGQPSSR